MLEKKTEYIKERIMMKKEEQGEYKREETDSKVSRVGGGGDSDFKKEKKREIHCKELAKKP